MAAPKVTDIFSQHQSPVGPLCADRLDALFQIAAVYLGHNTILDPCTLSTTEYQFSGSYEEAVIKSGSLKLLELCLSRESSTPAVCKLLRAAESHSTIDQVQCIYDRDVTSNRFLRNATRISRPIKTPQPEI